MKLKEDLRFAGVYTAYIAKWLFVAVLIGTVSGLVGALFYNGVSYATELRENNSWIIYLMPAAGLIIVWIYRLFSLGRMGTDRIIDAAREGGKLEILLLPAIFIGTILTHLTGGSAGREGAALQIGGNIGNAAGRILRFSDEDMKIATMVGMSALFSALFGTPLTAAVFVVFFVDVGTVYTAAVFPGLVASLTSFLIAKQFGMIPFAFTLTVPEFSISLITRVAALSALCGLLSTLFIKVLHLTGKQFAKYIRNEYIRAAAGGVLIILMTIAVGNGDYNGAGGGVIRLAVEEGKAVWPAFLLKILFTAVTLESGYKGGEIVPTFFIGATFGCVIGPLLGIPAGFAAAVGLIATFCGATNSMIASVFLSVEAFGAAGLLYFAVSCAVSYLTSAYEGLYASQTIQFSKVSMLRIDRKAGKRQKNGSTYTKDV